MSETTRRRWGMPATAAAAVLAVVGVGVLANLTGDEPGRDRARLSGAEGSSGCGVLTAAPGLEGFEQAGEVAYDGGSLSFWVDGARWLVCDDLDAAPTPAGDLDVWAPPQRLGPGGFDERDLAYRARDVVTVDGTLVAVHLVAAGKLMTDMESIGYTFPDGHEEPARIVQAGGERWWFVTYTATEGPLLDAADPAEAGPTYVSLLTPSADTGDGPMIGGAAQAFVVPQDRSPSLVEGSTG